MNLVIGKQISSKRLKSNLKKSPSINQLKKQWSLSTATLLQTNLRLWLETPKPHLMNSITSTKRIFSPLQKNKLQKKMKLISLKVNSKWEFSTQLKHLSAQELLKQERESTIEEFLISDLSTAKQTISLEYMEVDFSGEEILKCSLL